MKKTLLNITVIIVIVIFLSCKNNTKERISEKTIVEKETTKIINKDTADGFSLSMYYNSEVNVDDTHYTLSYIRDHSHIRYVINRKKDITSYYQIKDSIMISKKLRDNINYYLETKYLYLKKSYWDSIYDGGRFIREICFMKGEHIKCINIDGKPEEIEPLRKLCDTLLYRIKVMDKSITPHFRNILN